MTFRWSVQMGLDILFGYDRDYNYERQLAKLQHMQQQMLHGQQDVC